MSASTADPKASPGSVPDELVPKRGRPPGSKNKPREAEEISRDVVASAWAGLWLLATLLTWALAGKAAAPVARITEKTWRLEDLPEDERDEDAKALLGFVRALPSPVVTLLRFLGAPILMANRIRKHLVGTPVPKRGPPAELRKVPAPPDEHSPEPGLNPAS